jgi:CheY-like chemotaxis protein
VFRNAIRFAVGIAILFAVLGRVPAPAQDKDAPKKGGKGDKPADIGKAPDDYREFFKKPETVAEYWKAMQFEMEVGRFDLAARLLHGLLDKNPDDKSLVELVNDEGLSSLLRLRTISKWSDKPKEQQQATQDVEKLITSATEAMRKYLSDPDRIRKYIKNLNGSPEEYAYAVKQLDRSGAVAVPYLIESLQASPGDERVALLNALNEMLAHNKTILPPLLAALDSDDPLLQVDLVNILRKQAATAATPYLWPLAGSPRQPKEVRQAATEALAYFEGVKPDKLLPAKFALTREAERYYQHKVTLPEAVSVWRWNGTRVVLGWQGATTIPASKAEEYYGLRFAGQALDIDPTYQPAQVVFLSLALEKALEKTGLDVPLAKGAPDVQQLLTTVNPDLVVSILERALGNHRLPVILGAVRALGELEDARAGQPTGRGEPALVRALNYPDRRVQLAAALALLRLPKPPANLPAARVVEVLRRAVAAESAQAKLRVLAAHANEGVVNEIARTLEKAGFQVFTARTGRDVLRRLNEASDIDLVMVHADLPDPEIQFLVAQLRADVNYGLLPVVVLAPAARELRLQRLFERLPNVQIAPPDLALDADAQQRILPALVGDAMGQPLSAEERKEQVERALRALAQMARGEVAGYDIRPAADTILRALHSTNLGEEAMVHALQVAGRLPGAKAQAELADAVLDPKHKLPVRLAAAGELLRHIQTHSRALDRDHLQALESLLADPQLEPELRTQLALVEGAMRPTAGQTGKRLREFKPAEPGGAPAPAPAPEKAPEKDKDKDKEGK